MNVLYIYGFTLYILLVYSMCPILVFNTSNMFIVMFHYRFTAYVITIRSIILTAYIFLINKSLLWVLSHWRHRYYCFRYDQNFNYKFHFWSSFCIWNFWDNLHKMLVDNAGNDIKCQIDILASLICL